MATHPTDEQLETLLANDQGGPIRMLNLLKFREFAKYEDGSDEQLSGADAYMRYGIAVTELITRLGGTLVYSGQARTLVIGDGDLEWDMVSVVEYPSVAAFLEMTSSAEYQAVHVHREAGLAHQLLVQCQ